MTGFTWNLQVHGLWSTPWNRFYRPCLFFQLATAILSNYNWSCKVTALILDQLFIVTSILMFPSPYILLFFLVCTLVGPTTSLVWCSVITPSCCGSLNYGLCIAVFIYGSHISIMTFLLLKLRTYVCVLVIYGFLVCSMILLVFTRALLVFPISCSLYYFVFSLDIVTPYDDSDYFETYVIQIFT